VEGFCGSRECRFVRFHRKWLRQSLLPRFAGPAKRFNPASVFLPDFLNRLGMCERTAEPVCLQPRKENSRRYRKTILFHL
jgi:hypothetical protein